MHFLRWLPWLIFCGCATPAPTVWHSPRPPSPRQEFAQAAQRLEASAQWCFGHVHLRRVGRELDEEGLPKADQSMLLSELAFHQLRLGQTDQAMVTLQSAIDLANEHDKPDLLAQRAQIYLRQGERDNCVEDPTSQSCIYPPKRHRLPRPATEALADLLAAHPEKHVDRRWLLNLVAMQIGRYPQAVPKALRVLPPLTPAPDRVFQEVAAQSGIRDQDLCGGVVMDDFNGDGWLDIVSSSADYHQPVRLYKNLGNGRFELQKACGLEDQVGAFNVVAGDYDNDGDLDLLLVRGAFLGEEGRVRRSLMQNQGDGTFRDVTYEAGLATDAHPSGSAAWGDFDGDGWLDFVQANETSDPTRPHPCQLFHNNGDGTFRDVSIQAGLDLRIYAKGVAVGDIDNDGHLDLYFNDFRSSQAASRLLRNRGDGTFEDVTARWGVTGPPDRGFACWFFDYDNDGFLDLFAAGYEANKVDQELAPYLGTPAGRGGTSKLYHNDHGRRFVDVSRQSGLSGPFSIMGSCFGDFDQDGWLDVHLGTGAPFYDYLVPNRLLRNQKGKGFGDVTQEHGLGHLQKGHGCSFGDYDNDGDPDLFINLGGTFPADGFNDALFRNPGNQAHFLKVELVSKRPIIGARLRLDLEGQQLHRAVGCRPSFGSSPLREEFGLGKAARVKNLHIRWPDGQVQDLPIPKVDTVVRVTR
ncbi:hypothetical protein ABS71_03660 [bacterium SCN 62-11]|nr:MAG: hypothetical protein ABS71_03660 [bacterium SCN 62-11]